MSEEFEVPSAGVPERIQPESPQPEVAEVAPEFRSQPATGGTGLAPNVAGALCYFLGLVTGIVFLMIEKEDQSVRFHAMQSIVLSAAVFVVSIVLGFVPILGWLLGLLINLAVGVLWVVLMVKAYQGEAWEVPVLGKIAREQVAKMG